MSFRKSEPLTSPGAPPVFISPAFGNIEGISVLTSWIVSVVGPGGGMERSRGAGRREGRPIESSHGLFL